MSGSEVIGSASRRWGSSMHLDLHGLIPVDAVEKIESSGAAKDGRYQAVHVDHRADQAHVPPVMLVALKTFRIWVYASAHTWLTCLHDKHPLKLNAVCDTRTPQTWPTSSFPASWGPSCHDASTSLQASSSSWMVTSRMPGMRACRTARPCVSLFHCSLETSHTRVIPPWMVKTR
eukprot:279577-Chlamydomonas_euryale.AAC.1